MANDKKLAEKGNWDSDFADDNDSGGKADLPKTPYLDTSKGGDYTFRPVGPHIKCRKAFKPYTATLQDSDLDTDPASKAGWFFSKRYAINVIDRADGQLKVLEKGATVFKGFANYKSVFGKNPSDVKEGADFMLKVKIPKGADGKPNKLKTEYTVMHLKETPLTDAEVAMIKEKKLFPLTDIYKSTPLERRQAMWDALPESAKVPPKKEPKEGSGKNDKEEKPVSKPVEETMDKAPAETDDLFSDDKAKDSDKEDKDSAELF